MKTYKAPTEIAPRRRIFEAIEAANMLANWLNAKDYPSTSSTKHTIEKALDDNINTICQLAEEVGDK